MNIVRYEPWHLMGRLHREIDQLFGDTFATSPAGGSTAATWVPSVDVHEEPERYTVHADLPGVEAKDIQVTADKGVLTMDAVAKTFRYLDEDELAKQRRAQKDAKDKEKGKK